MLSKKICRVLWNLMVTFVWLFRLIASGWVPLDIFLVSVIDSWNSFFCMFPTFKLLSLMFVQISLWPVAFVAFFSSQSTDRLIITQQIETKNSFWKYYITLSVFISSHLYVRRADPAFLQLLSCSVRYLNLSNPFWHNRHKNCSYLRPAAMNRVERIGHEF